MSMGDIWRRQVTSSSPMAYGRRHRARYFSRFPLHYPQDIRRQICGWSWFRDVARASGITPPALSQRPVEYFYEFQGKEGLISLFIYWWWLIIIALYVDEAKAPKYIHMIYFHYAPLRRYKRRQSAYVNWAFLFRLYITSYHFVNPYHA